MDQKAVCGRPSCHNNLNTGSIYCSLSCAAKDRRRLNATKEAKSLIPAELAGTISEYAGDGAEMVLEAVSDAIIELRASNEVIRINPNAISKEGRTTGDWMFNWYNGQEFRPTEALSFDKIEAMDRSGIVQFAVRMVLAQIVALFRDDSTIKIICQDDELREVVEATFRLIMGKFIYDAMDNALRTGAGFMELVWRSCTKYELGLSKNRGGRKFTVLGHPRPVATESVKSIRRTAKGKFDGFIQDAHKRGIMEEVVVKLENAFILTFNERNRNKWGRSLYEAIYPLWFWYQIILRSMVRYMERMGSPVTVVSAPASKIVRKPGTDEQIDAMELGLTIAANASKSNALVIPSDVDTNTNKELWGIKYLTADERAQPFIDVLERMSVMILRAAFMADRSLTAGEVGAFNIGEIHEIANSIHNQMTAMLITHQINENIMPRLVRFNRGVNGPPCLMEAMVANLRDQAKFSSLLGISGNSPIAQEATGRIDWIGMAQKGGIPVIPEDEFNKTRKRQEEEALERQRKQIEMQAQAGVGSDNQVVREGARKSPNEEAKDKARGNGKVSQEEAIEEFIQLLVENDVVVPVMVNDGEIELFNPFRDKVGRFASGPGRGGARGKKQSKSKKKEGDKTSSISNRRNIGNAPARKGSFLVTTGKLLGIAGLGAVAVAAISALDETETETTVKIGGREYRKDENGNLTPIDGEEGGAGDSPNTRTPPVGLTPPTTEATPATENLPGKEPTTEIGDGGVDLDDGGAIEAIADAVKEVPSPPPVLNGMSPDEALGRAVGELQKIGVDPTSGKVLPLSYVVTDPSEGFTAQYDRSLNQIALSPQLVERLAEGDPRAIATIVHEVAHAAQDEPLTVNSMRYFAERVTIPGTNTQYLPYIEGQNTLLTSVVMSSIMDSSFDSGSPGSRYSPHELTLAGIAMAAKKNSGNDPVQFTVQSHDVGISITGQMAALRLAFPSQMASFSSAAGTRMPTMTTLNQWLVEEGVDPQKSLDEILDAASGL